MGCSSALYLLSLLGWLQNLQLISSLKLMPRIARTLQAQAHSRDSALPLLLARYAVALLVQHSSLLTWAQKHRILDIPNLRCSVIATCHHDHVLASTLNLSTLHCCSQAAIVETQALGRHAYFRARKLARIAESFWNWAACLPHDMLNKVRIQFPTWVFNKRVLNRCDGSMWLRQGVYKKRPQSRSATAHDE